MTEITTIAKPFHEYLIEQLRNIEYAKLYIKIAMEFDAETFIMAVRDVADAWEETDDRMDGDS